MKKRLLSLLIIFVMLAGLIPGQVFASPKIPQVSQAGNYGSFVDGAHVISDMIAKHGEKAHPRIFMSEDRLDYLKDNKGKNTTTAIVLNKLQKEADSKFNAKQLKYEIPDGIRLLETSKEVQRRVAALSLAYLIFEDDKYAKQAYKELENAANFPDWNPNHFLDTAEMCTAFAIGYDLLYKWMDKDQRDFIRQTMIDKGLKQVMEDYEDVPRERTYKWYKDQKGDNWKLVCTGGTNLAALAIGDEADARQIASEVLTYGYKEAYSFVRRGYNATDGSYKEGLGYWDYATYYLGLNSSSLEAATGTDYGLADYEGVRRSIDFTRYMSSNVPKSFNFGDDRVERNTGWAVFLWLGKYFNSSEAASIRLRNIPNDGFNYLDVLWIDEDKLPLVNTNKPTDWGAVGTSNASFRNTWDKSGLVAALHSGINDYFYHGHFDLGTFYIESNGSRFFGDLGNEDYELPNRKYSYRIRAEGHNTLVINPSADLDQADNVECLITGYRAGKEACAVTDLTAAYEPSGAKKVIRGLKMIKDKECVIVQDEISLNDPGEIYWFAHTYGQINIAEDGRSAVVTIGSDRLWVGLISEGGKFSVMKTELLPSSQPVSGQSDNENNKKLAIHLTDTKDTTISVAFIPLKNGETKPSWIPSGPIDLKESTTEPTATPTAKATAKPTVKPTAKPTAKTTAKPTAKPSAKPTAASKASLALNKTKDTIICGKSDQLKATVKGTSSKVSWKSSDPKIASVDSNGKVKASMAGTAAITATVNGKSASCAVTVLYKDVTDSRDFWYTPTNYLTAKGVVKGYDDQTKFKPANKCTRAQMVTFIWRLMGEPEPKTSKCKFSDVKKTDYFYKACIWGNENKIVEGYKDGTFGPQIVCARRHAVTFLWRLAGKPDPKTTKNKFSDVKKKDYFYKATLWASEKKILAGYDDGTFRPNGNCLRRQMVTFLYKYDKFINK